MALCLFVNDAIYAAAKPGQSRLDLRLHVSRWTVNALGCVPLDRLSNAKIKM